MMSSIANARNTVEEDGGQQSQHCLLMPLRPRTYGRLIGGTYSVSPVAVASPNGDSSLLSRRSPTDREGPFLAELKLTWHRQIKSEFPRLKARGDLL
jgi:hypothetical protein